MAFWHTLDDRSFPGEFLSNFRHPLQKSLRITLNTNVTHRNIAEVIRHFPDLEDLELCFEMRATIPLKAIQNLPPLHSLSIKGNISRSVNDFSFLDEQKSLKALSFYPTNSKISSLEELGKMILLEELQIGFPALDSSIHGIEYCSNLKRVSVYDLKHGESLNLLNNLPVEDLCINHSAVPSDGVLDLRGLSSLKTLKTSSCRIRKIFFSTEAKPIFISILKSCRSLKIVGLDSCELRVFEAPSAEIKDFTFLEGARELRYLYLSSPTISDRSMMPEGRVLTFYASSSKLRDFDRIRRDLLLEYHTPRWIIKSFTD